MNGIFIPNLGDFDRNKLYSYFNQTRPRLGDDELIDDQVNVVISMAVLAATGLRHEYVTLEHLATALAGTTKLSALLRKHVPALDSDALLDELVEHLFDDMEGNQAPEPSGGFEALAAEFGRTPQPKFSQAAAKAVQQIKHEMQRRNGKISPLAMLKYIIEDQESDAAYIFDCHKVNAELFGSTAMTAATGENGEEIPFCRNLNEWAKAGKIDPLIGRDSEVQRILTAVCRRRKNNVVMVGQPGVGKTAIAEGLAMRIVAGEVPKLLKDKEILSVSIGDMIAGTTMRGEFEERLRVVIEKVVERKAILFCDEIHQLVGAGTSGQPGSIDAAAIMKPKLANGELQVIGASTDEEFRTSFGRDRALMRRFTKVHIKEPSNADSKKILQGLKKSYEEHHEMEINDEAIDTAVDMSAKHLHGKFLPDKAIDLIDSAGAALRFAGSPGPVTDKEIKAEIAKVANIDISSVDADESDNFSELDGKLKAKIFGQDQAVDALVNAIAVSISGLREGSKTVGSFLFTGPTGTGKTETAKQLAAALGVHFLRYDMSEFGERHTVSRLIGSPPGYVGYHDSVGAGSGALLNDVETHPNAVLLLDEVEKAHPDVLKVLLQVMDNGMLSSSAGKTVSFRRAILIMSSNLGAAEAGKMGIGFEGNDNSKNAVTDAIKQFFTPEFRNRIDGTIHFNNLSDEIILKIVRKTVDEMNARIADKHVRLHLNDQAVAWVAKKGNVRGMGARPLKRVLEKHVAMPVANMMVASGSLANGGDVHVSERGGELKFRKETNDARLRKLVKELKQALAVDLKFNKAALRFVARKDDEMADYVAEHIEAPIRAKLDDGSVVAGDTVRITMGAKGVVVDYPGNLEPASKQPRTTTVPVAGGPMAFMV